MARIDRITKLSAAIEQRDKESEHALDQLDRFRKLLYKAIEEVFSAVAFRCACSPEPVLYNNLETKLVSRYALRLLVNLESQFSLVWQAYDKVYLDRTDSPCPYMPRYPVLCTKGDD